MALIPLADPGGCPRTVDMQEVVNAIVYILQTDERAKATYTGRYGGSGADGGCNCANIPERAGAKLVFARFQARPGWVHRLVVIWVDSGYQGKDSSTL